MNKRRPALFWVEEQSLALFSTTSPSFRRASMAILLVVTVTASCLAVTTTPGDKAATIDEHVCRYQERGCLNGAVLVAQHGKTSHAKDVGEADMQTDTPVTPGR